MPVDVQGIVLMMMIIIVIMVMILFKLPEDHPFRPVDENQIRVHALDLRLESQLELGSAEDPYPGLGEPGHLGWRRFIGVRVLPLPHQGKHIHIRATQFFNKKRMRQDAHNDNRFLGNTFLLSTRKEQSGQQHYQ